MTTFWPVDSGLTPPSERPSCEFAIQGGEIQILLVTDGGSEGECRVLSEDGTALPKWDPNSDPQKPGGEMAGPTSSTEGSWNLASSITSSTRAEPLHQNTAHSKYGAPAAEKMSKSESNAAQSATVDDDEPDEWYGFP